MASASNPMVGHLYLDNLYAGQQFTSDMYRPDEVDMVRFATEFDPQLFHLNRQAAEKSVFGSQLHPGRREERDEMVARETNEGSVRAEL
jgi:acyl dehydratase